MQGQNVFVSIYRAAQSTDDAQGGAQRYNYTFLISVRGRIAHRMPTLEMRAQGLSSDLLYDAAVFPATTDVQANDLIVPTTGPLALDRFLVTAVQQPSMVFFQSPRAHLRLQLERWDDGKMVELLAA